jgi:hypothetical protein
MTLVPVVVIRPTFGLDKTAGWQYVLPIRLYGFLLRIRRGGALGPLDRGNKAHIRSDAALSECRLHVVIARANQTSELQGET